MQVTRALGASSPPYESDIPATAGISSLTLPFSYSLTALLSSSSEISNPESPFPPFAVALSGGADSMALALLAEDYARAQGGRIVALTVDHGLRAESASETRHVATWMHERGIEHHILTPQHHNVSNNLQEAARIWRYDALAEYCAAHGILHCLVAHHVGDNRESFLHNETRGDTRDGRACMARIRIYRGVRFLRPLLGFEHAELEHLLRSKNATWIEDPSNQNPKFARVRNRKMLQENAAANAALDANILSAANARTARDHDLAEAAIHCARLDPLGFADITLAHWQTLEPTLASQLLADVITTISGATHRPRAADTLRLVAALQHPTMRKRTLQHCEITVRNGTIRIAREIARVEASVVLVGRGTLTWDHRFRVQYDVPSDSPLTLRALNIHGRKYLRERISLQTPKHMPHDLPLASPSLWHLDELHFVPYMGASWPDVPNVRIGFSPPKPLAAHPFW